MYYHLGAIPQGDEVKGGLAQIDPDRANLRLNLHGDVGQAVAFLFITLGLYRFFAGANFDGLWLAFIGWFLLDASSRSYVQVELMSGARTEFA